MEQVPSMNYSLISQSEKTMTIEIFLWDDGSVWSQLKYIVQFQNGKPLIAMKNKPTNTIQKHDYKKNWKYQLFKKV